MNMEVTRRSVWCRTALMITEEAVKLAGLGAKNLRRSW